MKFSLSCALFSLAYLSTTASATSAQCDTAADLVNNAPTNYEGEPITITSQDETSVTFTVSQTWSDDLLCLIATHHTNDDGEACPDVANAAPGEVAEYTANVIAQNMCSQQCGTEGNQFLLMDSVRSFKPR